MPTPCSIRMAVTMALILELALGPSGMFIASIPASLILFAFSSIFSAVIPEGGTSSIVQTFSPLAILAVHLDFSAKGRRGAPGGASGESSEGPRGASGRVEATANPPESRLIALYCRIVWAIALICSGPVPQQPPTKRTPSWRKYLVNSAKYSGVAM